MPGSKWKKNRQDLCKLFGLRSAARSKNQRSVRISAADLVKHFADCGDKVAQVILVDAADGSDSEAVGLAQLAGIDKEAVRTETPIEILESEVRIIRITKRSDDVALALGGQALDETKPVHSPSQCLVIRSVTGGASGYATFFAQFFKRSAEGQQRMGGRREAELAIAFKTFPLCEQIETYASRTAFTRFERFASRQHEGEAGNAFETFVRGRNYIIDRQFAQIDGHTAETAHRVHNEFAASRLYNSRNLVDRIQDAGGRFAMHDCYVRGGRFFLD